MEWTFGICTSGNLNNINKIIKSIFDQNIPIFEILIACENKIIGLEEYANVSLIQTENTHDHWLAKKKNSIILNAKFENIAILHDYLVLDKNWYNGFEKHGNNWHVCGSPTLNPFRDNERIADWLSLDHPYLGVSLIPYRIKRFSKYMFLSGMYFNVKKSFIISNELFIDEKFYGESIEDQEWSIRVRKFTNFKFNPLSTVLSLKDKKFEIGNYNGSIFQFYVFEIKIFIKKNIAFFKIYINNLSILNGNR